MTHPGLPRRQRYARTSEDFPAVERPNASVERSFHVVLLVTGGALLAAAGLLEFTIADAHGVDVGLLHEHTLVPGAVHALAVGSAMLTLWPALRSAILAAKYRRLGWRLAVVTAVAALLIIGQTMIGAGASWLFLFGSLAWRRRPS